ncbi:MAG TPA: asparagine synthase (glutamine-hydrolyzing) [Thermodesulfovibrionales bacterium]|nr:asparagine synthase (glutamine-hydrolyzing) [Thermodesulfovibrionales bacterium]
MCGIVSIFCYNSSSGVDHDELRRIRDYMINRGPDGYGEWYSEDNRIGLGHRRLAIIDLSESGAQPMKTADGRYVITFNGEIYNYKALRTQLEEKGYKFHSTSDTEVLLHLYSDKGPDMLHELRGMFAFAIWDNREKSLFLARDPFGIKPLYYSDNGKVFKAASQVKALLQGNNIDTALEPAGHVGFFLWGHVPEPYTLYLGIRSLQAGHYILINADGKGKEQCYQDIKEVYQHAEQDASLAWNANPLSALRSLLLGSVNHHLIADVPVGLFLSSGIDSTSLTGLACEINKATVHTVTLGFKEYVGTQNDETLLAKKIAEQFGARHDTVWISRNDFTSSFDHFLKVMDQPSIDGLNSYFVSKVAVQSGIKVALSGLGGDEIFGSYPSFKQIPFAVRFLRPLAAFPAFGRSVRTASTPLLKYITSPKYAGLLEYGTSFSGAYLLRRGLFMPWELPDVLDPEVVKTGWNELQPLVCLEKTVTGIRTDYLKVSALEFSWYMRNQLLRDTDWASMAHSLEIRTPFVDTEFLAGIAPFLTRDSRPRKQDIPRTLTNPLPVEVTQRPKTGFSVPLREWLFDQENLSERGLRGWAKQIYRIVADGQVLSKTAGKRSSLSFYRSDRVSGAGQTSDSKILALVPDAFGGHGGIALYNRDMLSAICRLKIASEVIAIPRVMPHQPERLPDGLTFMTTALNSKLKYVLHVLFCVLQNRRFKLIVCGHLNLLPLAVMVKMITRSPLLLEIYGIEAWNQPNMVFLRHLLKSVDYIISISEYTKRRFLAWSGVRDKDIHIVPNAINASLYGAGSKNPVLLDRYGLHGKTVLMTLGRLVSQERYKGFDEVIDILPELSKEMPNIAYLIVGDGSDRCRLEEKARTLGADRKVIFAGYISESEKADHYRLADVYVMPSQGEGFGFVYLEAMACGIPVVASSCDGSREAVMDGRLGLLVNPRDGKEMKETILKALKIPKAVPEDLKYFSFERFVQRLEPVLTEAIRKGHGNGQQP